MIADSNSAAEQWVKALADSSASHGFPVTGPLKVSSATTPLSSVTKVNVTKSDEMVAIFPLLLLLTPSLSLSLCLSLLG